MRGTVVAALGLAALLLAPAPAQAFRNYDVSSDAMLPTLGAGDTVTAALYGIDYEAMARGEPFLRPDDPAFGPKRGDVAFFAVGDTTFVMRIVALPGERVEMRGGRLVLDGVPVPTVPVAPVEGACPKGETCRFHRETLPGGASHLVLDTVEGSAGDEAGPFTVPEGAYSVLGDNRDNSADSRFGGTEFGLVGFVPRASLVGRLHAILSSPRPGDPAERVGGFPDRR